MKRVVLIGLDPATVDFSDPALPRGMTAEKIHAGVNSRWPISQRGAGMPKTASSSPTRLLSRRLNAAWPITSTTA
jgi:hypothetical protein